MTSREFLPVTAGRNRNFEPRTDFSQPAIADPKLRRTEYHGWSVSSRAGAAVSPALRAAKPPFWVEQLRPLGMYRVSENVEFREPVEAIAAVAHYPACLQNIAERIGQFQHSTPSPELPSASGEIIDALNSGQSHEAFVARHFSRRDVVRTSTGERCCRAVSSYCGARCMWLREEF